MSDARTLSEFGWRDWITKTILAKVKDVYLNAVLDRVRAEILQTFPPPTKLLKNLSNIAGQ